MNNYPNPLISLELNAVTNLSDWRPSERFFAIGVMNSVWQGRNPPAKKRRRQAASDSASVRALTRWAGFKFSGDFFNAALRHVLSASAGYR